MTKIEAFRRAAAELGEATSEEMSAFIESKFGVLISPPYIPLFQATFRFRKSPSLAGKSGGSEQHPLNVR